MRRQLFAAFLCLWVTLPGFGQSPRDEIFDRMIVSPADTWEGILQDAKVSPDDLVAQRKRLRDLVRKDKFKEAADLARAIDFASASLSGSPSNDYPEQIKLIGYLKAQRKLNGADQVLASLKAGAPDGPNVQFAAATLLADRNPTAAVNLLQQALAGDLNPAYREEATALMGQCYASLGNESEARKTFEEVLKANPRNSMARAWMDALSGKTTTPALGAQTTVRATGNALQLFDQGEQAFAAGRYQEALKFYDQALTADPKFAKAATYKGDAYYKLGDVEKAIASYRQAIAIDPRDKQAYRFLGDVLETKYDSNGDTKLLREALSCYENALRIDPSYGLARECVDRAKAKLNSPRRP